MNIDEDTSAWLGCPTPLELYKHQCALLEDELTQAQVQLTKARRNIAGLVHMNDVLISGKARADNAATAAAAELEEFKRACTEPGVLGMKLVEQQRDHLFRENQRLLLEVRDLRERCAPLITSPAP